jgi:thymidylate synthase (FAD)
LIDHQGSDLSVARAARVSYEAAWRAGKDVGSDAKLIRYLWTHEHTSPFEAVTFTFEVKAPIFVLRQWQRHRTWSYNEVSARYTELPEEFYVPSAENVGEQATKNKQGRQPSALDRTGELFSYRIACEAAFDTYRELLDAGWPRELARNVLPLATYSHMFATVNLRNLAHFLSLRLDPHAQWEIQQYAKALTFLIGPIVPVCLDAFRINGELP